MIAPFASKLIRFALSRGVSYDFLIEHDSVGASLRLQHEIHEMSVMTHDSVRSIWFFAGQVDDSGTVRCLPIHTTPFLIGRRSDLALHLPRPTVSTVHAQITEQQGVLILRDLKSTNGTFINGKRLIDEAVLSEDDLIQFADVAFRVRRQVARQQGETVSEDVVDRAMSLVQFDKLMRERTVVPHFQPLVEMNQLQVIGHEVLGRSNLFGLESPLAMFRAASQLDLEVELSRMLRWEAIRVGADVPQLEHLFVNTHPVELAKPGLIASLEEVRAINPNIRLTLEIHEAAVADIGVMREIREQLRKLDIGLAFDDFGAGQARLQELIEVSPDVLKVDMALIRGIDQASAQRQQMVALLTKMAHEVGSIPLAEGVETVAEHETCLQLGFGLGQGFLYGRPVSSSALQSSALNA